MKNKIEEILEKRGSYIDDNCVFHLDSEDLSGLTNDILEYIKKREEKAFKEGQLGYPTFEDYLKSPEYE